MSQEAGTSGISKFCFFSETSFSCLWVTGYASTLKAHVRVQWVISPLSFHAHFVLACKGGQSLHSALCRIKLRTSRLTAQCFQPLNNVVDEISCQNVSIYAQGILNYQENSKKSKFKKLTFPGIELSISWLSVSYWVLNH